MQYFDLPNCHIAFNAKVGSTALASAIVNKFYPEVLQEVLDKHERTYSQFTQEFLDALPESFQIMLKNEKLDSKAFWQRICPSVYEPTKPILLAVREPVTRFVSTVAYLELDPEESILALENNTRIICEGVNIHLRRNTHFAYQHTLIRGDTRFYKFPDQLERMCRDAGLDYPLPVVNETKHEKPKLTDDQIERVKKYYAQDVKLYNSIPNY